jgi:hypothetical protein
LLRGELGLALFLAVELMFVVELALVLGLVLGLGYVMAGRCDEFSRAFEELRFVRRREE